MTTSTQTPTQRPTYDKIVVQPLARQGQHQKTVQTIQSDKSSDNYQSEEESVASIHTHQESSRKSDQNRKAPEGFHDMDFDTKPTKTAKLARTLGPIIIEP